MSRILFLLFVIAFAAAPSVFADAPPPLTANFYTVDAEKYLNKSVSLSVGCIDMSTLQEAKDGTKTAKAYTLNNLSDGGWILIVAKPEVMSRIVKLCGTDNYAFLSGFRPHIIQGTFVKEGTSYAVRIDK